MLWKKGRPAALTMVAAGLLLLGTGGCGGEGESGEGGGGENPSRTGAEAPSSRQDRGGGRGGARRGGPPGRGGSDWGGGAPAAESGVPVEVATVERGAIASFFVTQSTLEAENEVDVVSRVAGPIVELKVEEGDRVRAGQLLAKLDDRELRTQLQAAEVRRAEAAASFARTRSLFEQELVSRDLYDQAKAASDTALAETSRLEVQLDYTTISAPFSGLVVERYVKFAEYVQNGARVVRLSDFDPLLAPIQVPERHLQRLRRDQAAQLTVEAFGDRRFSARVLRIRPVVDATSGTIEVTLEVNGEGDLRPGMFSAVELEMERRDASIIVPRVALTLDSLQPTVFVVADGEGGGPVAARRQLEIGLRNDRELEVLSGLEAGERVVVVGQDGLADGTPLELEVGGAPPPASGSFGGPPTPATGAPGQGARVGPRGDAGPELGQGQRRGERRGPPGFLRDLDWDDPGHVEKVKERMRQRGLSEDQIDERLERMRARFGDSGGEGG